MVSQGDIIKISFDPQKGHEQSGWRTALVVSNDVFNVKTQMTIVCPITNTDNHFPLHVPLDNRTTTTGVILCEHVRTLDINAGYSVFVEKIPDDLMKRVIAVVKAQF